MKSNNFNVSRVARSLISRTSNLTWKLYDFERRLCRSSKRVLCLIKFTNGWDFWSLDDSHVSKHFDASPSLHGLALFGSTSLFRAFQNFFFPVFTVDSHAIQVDGDRCETTTESFRLPFSYFKKTIFPVLTFSGDAIAHRSFKAFVSRAPAMEPTGVGEEVRKSQERIFLRNEFCVVRCRIDPPRLDFLVDVVFNRLFLGRLNFHDDDNSSSSNPIKHEPSPMFLRSATLATNQEVVSENVVTLMMIHLGRHKCSRSKSNYNHCKFLSIYDCKCWQFTGPNFA